MVHIVVSYSYADNKCVVMRVMETSRIFFRKPNDGAFPQMAPTDDAVNLTSELHDPNAQVNYLHNRRKKKT